MEPAGRLPSFGWSPRAALLVGVLASAAMLVPLVGGNGQDQWLPPELRAALVIFGATFVPGIPIVIALRIPGRALAASLAVALSLATTILVSQFSLIGHWWNPYRTQTVLGVSALVLCVAVWLRLPSRFRVSRNRYQNALWMDRWRATELVALVAAVVLFARQTSTLDYMAAGKFGIITEVGWPYVAGLVLISCIVAVTLTRSRIDHVVMAASTVVLITYATLLVPIATGESSFPTAFVHRGFITAIMQEGALPKAVDARFSWAGFFSAGAHLTSVAHLPDSQPFMALAPLYFNCVLAFPVYAIAVAVTGRTRVAWLAVVLYQLFNWYQQDYFAPQSVALVFYSTIIATLLWQFRCAPLPRLDPGVLGFLTTAPRRTLGLVPGFGRARTAAIGAALIVLIAANVVTHQITPLLVVISLGFFSLLGATRYRVLWLVAGLIFAAWFTYGASDYWMGHLYGIFSEVGKVGSSVTEGVGDRLTGDPVYKKMQYLRIGASAAFAVLGFMGWIAMRGRRSWLLSGALFGAAFLLIALQGYDGEVVIRSFVLSAPMLAPLAAFGISRASQRLWITRDGAVTAPLRWSMVAALAVVLTALGIVVTTNRGLNTAFEATTPELVAATDEFVASASPSSSIMSWSYSPPALGANTIGSQTPDIVFVDKPPCLADLGTCALDQQPSYIYITSQGMGMLEFQDGVTYDRLSEAITKIVDSGHYVPMVDKPTILILRRTDSPPIGEVP
ncbi:hypothetical protein FK531_04625 [Rhodococcus spelaei]|uniref:Uncharacterized protein n=1 Tax=Rhodococcus spelaei TaxID=2546320 RepID=A0A541BPZ5_9NOCA|nr:hypothetical protein FK531_04625 [Rhodococcus spelaei]